MKIYFTCSARGTDKFGDLYALIFKAVKDLGHTHADDYTQESDPDKVYSLNQDERVKLYKDAVSSLKRSDIVILEVSVHSLSMGYLMHRALELNKPVIALHLPKQAPAFAAGIDNEKLQLLEYTKTDIKNVLKNALEYAAEVQDTRFNFFVAPKHQNYLDWIAKNRKVPRAVHLRRLLEKDMADNKEYQAELGKGKPAKK